jgi:hypothetical protein
VATLEARHFVQSVGSQDPSSALARDETAVAASRACSSSRRFDRTRSDTNGLLGQAVRRSVSRGVPFGHVSSGLDVCTWGWRPRPDPLPNRGRTHVPNAEGSYPTQPNPTQGGARPTRSERSLDTIF